MHKLQNCATCTISQVAQLHKLHNLQNCTTCRIAQLAELHKLHNCLFAHLHKLHKSLHSLPQEVLSLTLPVRWGLLCYWLLVNQTLLSFIMRDSHDIDQHPSLLAAFVLLVLVAPSYIVLHFLPRLTFPIFIISLPPLPEPNWLQNPANFSVVANLNFKPSNLATTRANPNFPSQNVRLQFPHGSEYCIYWQNLVSSIRSSLLYDAAVMIALVKAVALNAKSKPVILSITCSGSTADEDWHDVSFSDTTESFYYTKNRVSEQSAKLVDKIASNIMCSQ